MAKYDVIVVGGGQNSLTAAAYLAAGGLKVLVFDKNPIVGGGTVSREITQPGFVHDTHAGQMVIIMANPLIANDELGLMSRFGLKFAKPDVSHCTVFDDETCIATYFDVDATCRSIAKFSERRRNASPPAARMQALGGLLLAGMFRPPLPFASSLALLDHEPGRSVAGGDAAERVRRVCATHAREKASISEVGFELMLGPEEKGTGRDAAVSPRRSSIPIRAPGRGVRAETADALVGAASASRWRGARKHGSHADPEFGRSDPGRRAQGRWSALEATKAIVGQRASVAAGQMVQGIDAGVASRARSVRLSAFGAVNLLHSRSRRLRATRPAPKPMRLRSSSPPSVGWASSVATSISCDTDTFPNR
jgi:hypothetical protein